MQSPVVHLLPRPKAAGDEEGVHVRLVGERVVGNDGEAGLRLDRPHALGDEEGVELGIEAPGDGKHAVGRGEIDDLEVLAHVDPEPEASLLCHHTPRQ